MAKISMIDQRLVRDLVPSLEAALRAEGYVTADDSQLEVLPDTWRRAVRLAAKKLGRKVRTHRVDGTLFAELADWPRDAAEERIDEQRLDEVADAMKHGWREAGRQQPTPIRPQR